MERLLDKQAWSQLMDAGKKKPEGKEGAALVSNVIDKEGTPANNKENVVLNVVGKDETVSDIGNDDSKEASTQDLGTDNIDGDNTCTDDNITDNESFRDATPEHSTPDMEGTTTPVTAEEDSKCISSNETTEDFTMGNLSIGDNNSNDKPKEEYDDKHQ
ncbi:hypothetical protein INT48_004828 [Thamnidium elegans]|uniref:Uncharacterized protein n=1 Tax=Thamnidium elegans TaxID=101142 RepID=A0A8H7SHV3_9FUNG|nr:hypothetical protein INT48_004828 [Thamnidium elegans]